ncbi:MAG: hypothetical protein KME30_29980 [Iphinoe sp. HA4291-MV1]|nr:hypothetical protein [Iphinoe sp. HA4291-MV1]
MARGTHPTSLANLSVPQLRYGEPKRQRNISITDTGWQNLKELAQEHEISLADMLERIARKDLKIVS